MTVTGSQFYSLAAQTGSLEPTGEVGSGFSLQAAWMKNLEPYLKRGTVFEHDIMNPILDMVESLTGAKIHRDTSFSGTMYGVQVSGHPDWIVQYGGETTVIDAKRGYEHENTAYWFQPGLYAAAIENGLISKVGKVPVNKIGTTFFNDVAEQQIKQLVESAGNDEYAMREVAYKILNTITGKSIAPELSAVRPRMTDPLASDKLGRAVGTLDKVQNTVRELTGRSMEDLFNSARPGSFAEEETEKKQRKDLEDVIRLHLIGYYSREDTKRMVGNILSSSGGLVLGERKNAAMDQLKNPQRKEYLFIDLETGGFAEHYGGYGNIPIASIGYQLFDADMNPIGEKKQWIINDSHLANNPAAFASAEAKHGISLETMKASPNTFASILPEIQRLAKGRILGGYNSDAYDMKILQARGLDTSGPRIDVALLAKARHGYMPSLEKAYSMSVGGSFEGAHGAAEDARATGLVAQSYIRNRMGNNPENPDYGHINQMPSWQTAPGDLLSRLGPGAKAKISPDGRQVAFHDDGGNVFFVGRLARTQAGYTINGRSVNEFQATGQILDKPIQPRDLYQRVLNKYGIGGPAGVEAAMKEWYDNVENMTIVNEKAFLSPARAAQIRSAAVRSRSAKSPLEWYDNMRRAADAMKDESLKALVFRSMDSRFLFDLVKTIAAHPTTLIRDGKIFAGSSKLPKTVQQMAREQAMSTDTSRNFASLFIKPGEEIQFGVLMKTMEASILPEGTAFSLERVELYEHNKKYVKNEEQRDLVVLDRKDWKSQWTNGKLEHAIAYDTKDNQLIWVQAQSANDITEVETRRGSNNQWELGYNLRSRGTTQGGQIKSWLNKAVWAELNREELNLRSQSGATDALDLLIQIGKNPRFAADMVLSGQFRMNEDALIEGVRKHLGGKYRGNDSWLIDITEQQKQRMTGLNVAMSGRRRFINTSIPEVNDAVGKFYAEHVSKMRQSAGEVTMDYPMDYMYYRSVKIAGEKGGGRADFSLPEMTADELNEWRRNPGAARKIKVTFHNPLVADMLHFTTLLHKEGTPSMPAELVATLFDKYGSKLGKQFARYSERDRAPYQDILRTFMATQGEVEETRLTEAGRKIVHIDELRKLVDINADLATQLKTHLGNGYIYVPPESTTKNGGKGFYISGESLQFIFTPNAISRMKRNIAHQAEGQDEEEPEEDIQIAEEAVNASWRQLKNLLKYNSQGQQQQSADRLYESMFGSKGLARTQAVWRGGVGMVMPGRYGAQGTYTAVPGLALNEILISNEILQRWLPGVNMAEINRVMSGVSQNEMKDFIGNHQGLTALAQRFPNVSDAISALSAFRVVSEDELIKRGGYARKRGFSGIGMSQMSMETIFGDTDGDQIAAFFATVYNISKVVKEGKNGKQTEANVITGLENNPTVVRMSSFGGRLAHLQKSLGVITGDDRFVRGEATIDEVMDKMASLSDDVTNLSEIGKWIGSMATMAERYGVDENGMPKGWNEGVTIEDAYKKFLANAEGKRQMGSSYNRFIRDLGMAAEKSTTGLEGDVQSAKDPRAWLSRANVLFHQLSVDMLRFGDQMQGYVEMTENFNPFNRAMTGTAEFSRGGGFIGSFDQAVWKIVEQIVGSSTEFRGVGGKPYREVGGERIYDEINRVWQYDIARAITNKEEYISKIEKMISARSIADLQDASKVKELADQIKDEVFAGSRDELLSDAGPMLAVPVATWLSKGKAHALKFAGVAGNNREKMEELANLGEEMTRFRRAAKGNVDLSSVVEAIYGLRGNARAMASRILNAAKGNTDREMAARILDEVGKNVPLMAPNKEAIEKSFLARINKMDYNVLGYIDDLVNRGEAGSRQEVLDVLGQIYGDVFDAGDDHPIWGAIGEEARNRLSDVLGQVKAHQVMTNQDMFGSFQRGSRLGGGQQSAQSSSPQSGAIPMDALMERGGYVTRDAQGHLYIIPKDARELNQKEVQFAQDYLFSHKPKQLTREERMVMSARFADYGIGNDLLSYQEKLQKGQLNEGQIRSFDFKFNASPEQELSLWENYKSGLLAAQYGEGFMGAVTGGGNPYELMKSGQITAHGYKTLSNIQGGKGQQDVLELVDRLRSLGADDQASEIFNQYFGSVENKTRTKIAQERAKAMEREFKQVEKTLGTSDVRFGNEHFRGLLKSAGASRSVKPSSAGAAENIEDVRSLFFGTPGDSEGLAQALDMYADKKISKSTLQSWARASGISGVGKMIGTIDAMNTGGGQSASEVFNNRSRLMGLVNRQIDESSVGLTGNVNKLMDEFGGHLKSVNGLMKDYGDLLDRLKDPEKYQATSNQQRSRDRGLWGGMQSMSEFAQKFGDEGVKTLAARAGVSTDQINRVVASAAQTVANDQYVQQMQPREGALKTIASLIGGDVEGLGWTMFNARRVWNMTGGQVTDAMQQYAKYTAARQEAISGMGGGGQQGFYGSAAAINQAENAITRTRLQVGKAGWDIWGNLITGLGQGGSPDQPGLGAYAVSALGPVVGFQIMKGIVGKYAGKFGLGEKLAEGLSESSSGVSGAIGSITGGRVNLPVMSTGTAGGVLNTIGRVAMDATAAIAGYELGKGFGFALAPSFGNKTTGYTSDQWSQTQWHNVGKWLGGEMTNLQLEQIKAQATGDWSRFNDLASKSAAEEKKFRASIGLGDMDARQEQYGKYTALAKRIEDRYSLQEGQGLINIQALSGMTGIMPGSAYANEALMAVSGITNDQLRQQRIQLGTAMARGSGVQWGSDQMAQAITQATKMNETSALMMQDTLNRISAASSFFQAQGIQMPGLMGKRVGAQDALNMIGLGGLTQALGVGGVLNQAEVAKLGGIQTMSAQAQSRYGQFWSGDKYTGSALGMALSGRGGMEDWMSEQYVGKISKSVAQRLISLNPLNGTQIGYDWGSGIMMQNYGTNAGVTPYMKYANMYGAGYDTARFSTSLGNYNLSEQGLQQAQFETTQWDRQFGLAQSQRKFDLSYAYTTGRAGPLGTGSSSEFTTGGPVTIRLNGQTKIVNDVVTGQPIQGRGQWQMEDWSTQLQRFQQQQQFGFQQRGIDLNNKYFMENRALQMAQFQYDTQYQQRNFALQQEKINTQYQWGREDLAYQGAGQTRQYTYNMEDIAENLRYATGRERRLLLRQRNRATVEYSVGQGRLDVEEGRLDVRKKWDQEELDRSRDYFNHKIAWQKEEFDISLRQHNDEIRLQQDQLNTSKDAFSEENRLRDEATRLNRQYWTATTAEEQKSIAHQSDMIELQATLEANQIILGTLQQLQAAGMANIWANGGPIDTAVKDFAARAKTYIEGAVPGDTNSVPFINQWTPHGGNSGPQQ